MQRRYEEVGTTDSPQQPLDPSRCPPPPQARLHHEEDEERNQFQQDSDTDSVHTIDYVSDQGSVLIFKSSNLLIGSFGLPSSVLSRALTFCL